MNMRFRFTILLSLLMLAGPALAQRVRPDSSPPASRPSEPRRPRLFRALVNPMAEAFRDAAADAARATVQVRCDGKDAAFGTVVGADGWIITKASELSGKITCQLRGGRSFEARLMGVAEDHDVAMLKIAATDLPTVTWAGADPAMGELLATTGTTDLPVAVGVLSIARRKVPSRNVVLGVLLEQANGGVRVVQVTPDSGAAKAGIQVDDLITAVAGKRINTREELINIVTGYHLGDEVDVGLRRGDRQITVKAVLGNRPTTAPSRAEVMNALGGPLSRVSSGFAAVVQHDAVLRPQQCGGPLVNLDGKVVGVNIARAGRTETYAVPAEVLRAIIPDLQAGKYPRKSPQLPPIAPASNPATLPRRGPRP